MILLLSALFFNIVVLAIIINNDRFRVRSNLNTCSAVAQMGDRLATIDMGRKEVGAAVPLSVGKMSPHLTQCGLGRDLPPYQVAY